MADELKPPLTWAAKYALASPSPATERLHGDKILLPPVALEQLLSAATASVPAETLQNADTYFHYFDNDPPFAATQQRRSQPFDRQPQLPQPLTFRLVNSRNDRVVYAGIREFSANEGEVGLSHFLRTALGIDGEEVAKGGSHDGARDLVMTNGDDFASKDGQPGVGITVHSQQLPKGTYVRLRPLEAGYDAEDWKSLLEHHLRSNFTTLTQGEVLSIPKSTRKGVEHFKFIADKLSPEGPGICIVDTDLEVDIEPLNEEQARETLKRHAERLQKAPNTANTSSVGGKINTLNEIHGKVQPGDYVDYELPLGGLQEGLEIEISGTGEGYELDLFVSPFGSRQRAKPRDDEHVFGTFENRPTKRIRINLSNPVLEGAELLWISVHGYSESAAEDHVPKTSAKEFGFRTSLIDPSQVDVSIDEEEFRNGDSAPDPNDIRCKNCHQWIPSRTMLLHENFCYRNNVFCPRCLQVFKKTSSEWTDHWHCPHDSAYGNSFSSHSKHDSVFHETQQCPECPYVANSLPALAQHRTTLCPAKIILCRFCHLLVPQEGDPDIPSAEALLSGLTPHELADGARTTECHLCAKIVRLRDMPVHLKHHELDKAHRIKPRVCRNNNCGRTLYGVGKTGQIGSEIHPLRTPRNEMGLCDLCYGPLYAPTYDPEGKALKRRVERKYLSQLLTGCQKSWCRNQFCKQGRVQSGRSESEVGITAKDALPMVKPYIDAIGNVDSPLHFCVGEDSQVRRSMAHFLAAGGEEEFDLEWSIAALEAEAGDADKARTWLQYWAPSRERSMAT